MNGKAKFGNAHPKLDSNSKCSCMILVPISNRGLEMMGQGTKLSLKGKKLLKLLLAMWFQV